MGFKGGGQIDPPPSISWFSSTPAGIGLILQFQHFIVLPCAHLEIVCLPSIYAMSGANNMVFIYDSGTTGMVIGTNDKIMVL